MLGICCVGVQVLEGWSLERGPCQEKVSRELSESNAR